MKLMIFQLNIAIANAVYDFLIKYRYKAIFYIKKSITSFKTVCFAAITLKSIAIVTPASRYVTSFSRSSS